MFYSDNAVTMKPLVSISVPVYNTEKYLRQCLDSLVNQTLLDIEIIIVNDGSTDNSEAICREYAEKDPRIKLICKENGGLASARQAALENANGKYFCACDSDDWVEPDIYERLYMQAEETNADIVMCDYWSEYPDGRQIASVYSRNPNDRKDLLADALNGMFPNQVWNKMFRREIFDKYSLSWEPGINLGEDFLITLKILQHDVKVAYLPSPLYHYRREFGGNSYTNNITMSTFRQSYRIRQWVMDNVDTEKYANGIFRLWLSLSFTALRVKEGMSSKYYRTEILSHMPYGGFFKYNYPKLKGLLIFSAKLFGYRFARGVFKLTYGHVYR